MKSDEGGGGGQWLSLHGGSLSPPASPQKIPVLSHVLPISANGVVAIKLP